MLFFLLLLVAVPVYGLSDVNGDLLGQEYQPVNSAYIRDRRQAHQNQYRALSQAPPQIQQLLQAQQARSPLVHLPAQKVPQLAPAQPAQPQHLPQAQVSQYKPQVQYGSAPQQPTYKSIQPKVISLKPAAPQQPQYRPAPNYHQQAAPQQNYRPTYNPAPAQQHAAQPQYSNRLPPQLQQLVQLQQNIANGIPQNHGGAPQSKISQRLY